MFPIMFETRHALLLPGGRIPRPQSGRSQGAEQARCVPNSWPQTRRGRERELIQVRTQPRFFRVREQSAHTLIPRQQAGQQSVRSCDSNTASTGRDQALVLATSCPNTVRVRGVATNISSVCLGIFHATQRAMACPRSSIVVDITPDIRFPVQIKMIPSYDYV